MAKPRSIEPHDAIKLKEKGWTHAQIAEHAGITVSGVQQILSKAGYKQRKQTSHKENIPFVVATQHKTSQVYGYLRVLSLLAKGKKIRTDPVEHGHQAKTAIDWANKILDQDKDVDYDRDKPPSDFSILGGFYLTEPYGYLSGLMQKVISTQTRKL